MESGGQRPLQTRYCCDDPLNLGSMRLEPIAHASPPSGDPRIMSRRGNPYDNAHVESFFKTLKHEEIFANDYSTIDDLANRLPHFLE